MFSLAAFETLMALLGTILVSVLLVVRTDNDSAIRRVA